MEGGVFAFGKIAKPDGLLNLLEGGPSRRTALCRERRCESPSVPTILDYALAIKPSTQLEADIEALPSSSVIAHSARRLFTTISNVTASCFFFMIQGYLLWLLWAYPAVQIPVVLASASVTMMYYNLTVLGSLQWIVNFAVTRLGGILAWLVEQLGSSAGKFTFAILFLYVAVLGVCGLFLVFSRSLSWRCTSVWRKVSSTPTASLPIARLPCGSADIGEVASVNINPSFSTSVADSDTNPLDIPDAHVGLSDVSSIDSGNSLPRSDHSPSKRVCQAHLVHFDRNDGPALCLSACNQRQIKDVPMFNVDLLLQHGIKKCDTSGPVMVDLCKGHREAYLGRTVELKCQTRGCWEIGILMEHRGSKFLECRVRLQIRLGSFGPTLPGPVGSRRNSRNARESPVDSKHSVATFAESRVSRRGVSFDDDSSVHSGTSSESTPELSEVYVEEAPAHIRRTSTASLMPHERNGGTEEQSHADMADVAVDLLNHRGRRNSAPSNIGEVTASVEPSDLPRRKAYHFDDMPDSKPIAGVAATLFNESTPHTMTSQPLIAVQGKIVPTPTAPPVVQTNMDQPISQPKICVQVLSDNRNLANVSISAAQQDSRLAHLFPDFLRKRVAPGRHEVVPHQVDHGLISEKEQGAGKSSIAGNDLGALLKLKSGKHD